MALNSPLSWVAQTEPRRESLGSATWLAGVETTAKPTARAIAPSAMYSQTRYVQPSYTAIGVALGCSREGRDLKSGQAKSSPAKLARHWAALERRSHASALRALKLNVFSVLKPEGLDRRRHSGRGMCGLCTTLHGFNGMHDRCRSGEYTTTTTTTFTRQWRSRSVQQQECSQ